MKSRCNSCVFTFRRGNACAPVRPRPHNPHATDRGRSRRSPQPHAVPNAPSRNANTIAHVCMSLSHSVAVSPTTTLNTSLRVEVMTLTAANPLSEHPPHRVRSIVPSMVLPREAAVSVGGRSGQGARQPLVVRCRPHDITRGHWDGWEGVRDWQHASVNGRRGATLARRIQA